MSGRQIGSALGFVVGMYFGNPQLGMMIGGMVGGAISPDKVQGAKIGELPVQRSLTGGVQPVVLGTSLVDQCLVMWAGTPRIVKEKESAGKGGGPVVVNEVMYQDYRIRVCRSSAADGSTVQGFPVIFEDGRLVYDMRENPRISRADSAKWAANVTFYYGGADQEPDPTEELDVGVGNASAHRQIASFVKKNQKMTDFGNRIPTYEVVVSKCAIKPMHHMLVCGTEKGAPSNPVWAAATVGQNLSFVGLEQSIGADIPHGIPAWYGGVWAVAGDDAARYSIDDRESFQASTVVTYGLPRDIVGGAGGFMIHCDALYPIRAASSPPAVYTELTGDEYNAGNAWPSGLISSFHSFQVRGRYYVAYNRALWRADSPRGPFTLICDASTLEGNPNGDMLQNWWSICGGPSVSMYAVVDQHFSLPARQIRKSEDGGVHWYNADILVSRATGESHRPIQVAYTGTAEKAGHVVATAADNSIWTSANSWAAPIDIGITAGGSHHLVCSDGLAFIFSGGDKCVVFNPETLAVSAPVTLPITNISGAAASEDFAPTGGGIEIPDAPGHYIDPITGEVIGPSSDVGMLCGTTLAEIVRYICERGQLTDAELYLNQLEGIAVRGITLQSAGTCKDELDPLRQTHFFDPADFDGKLRFRMRGATAVDMVIDPDALVLTDDEDEDNRIIGQEVEFSRKHWFNYLSLDLDYLRTGAPSERTALDPTVVGESEAQANEVFSHEEAMRISAIQHRLLWMGQEGYRKFGLPLEYLELAGASLISLDGRRGRIDGYSIDLNAIWFDPVPYDRGSAYVANVVAPALTPPTGPGTTIRGPTISAVLNMPVPRDADDRAGVIWAATGPSAGWRGARLELSRAGSTYDVGPTIDRACTMGILAEALPAASRYGLDTTNALKVKLYPGARDLDGRTFEQLIASDDNALAIRYPDGTVELLQFMTAVETAEREYTLTGLLRGRKDTTAGTHLADAMVVLLDNNVRFIALRPEDVGATINFRATSLETDPDLAEVQAVTLTTIESLREWTPYAVSLESDGSGGYCATWIGRARLGSSLMPVQSVNFRDFAVTFAEGGDTLTLTTTDQALCQTQVQLEAAFGVGFGAPTVAVTAKSRIHSSFDSAAGAP